MKNIIVIIMLAALTSGAQVVPINVGNYPGDPSGEQIGHQLFVKLNYNLAYLQNQVTNLQAQFAALAAQNQVTNVVFSSSTVSLLSSNPFTFTGSDYLGEFTNIYSVQTLAGTNTLTNMMSVDGGSTWIAYAPTNPISEVALTNWWTNQVVTNILWTTNIGGTNYTLTSLGTNLIPHNLVYTNFLSGGVQLAVWSAGSCTGSVSVASLADPSLQGRLFTFAGEALDFGGLTTNIQFTDTAVLGGSTNTLYFTNGILRAVTTP